MSERFAWATGVAEVVSHEGRTVTVACPHCPETHTHARELVGSKQVVAGCHKGFSVCREYRIVDLRKNAGKRSQPRGRRRAA